MEKYNLGLNSPIKIPKLEDGLEKLDIKIELAREDDWQACKELRLLSITDPKSNKTLAVSPEEVERQKNKSDEEWKKETLSEGMFSVLAWNNSQAIGLGRTKKLKNNTWMIRNGYVRPEFEQLGVHQKLYALRLSEIIKRGGVKAGVFIINTQPVSLHNAIKFGFKEVSLIRKVINLGKSYKEWHFLEVDLKNPKVIKKIEEVLKK